MTGSFGDGGEDGRDRLCGCPGRGVDDQVATVPWLVLPAGDLLPIRQPQATDVHLAGLGPLAVRGPVGADELDLDQPGAVARQASLVTPSGLTHSATTLTPCPSCSEATP